eukprot:53739_1
MTSDAFMIRIHMQKLFSLGYLIERIDMLGYLGINKKDGSKKEVGCLLSLYDGAGFNEAFVSKERRQINKTRLQIQSFTNHHRLVHRFHHRKFLFKFVHRKTQYFCSNLEVS